MAWEPELLASLESALEQAPDQNALRLHVSKLYADGGRYIESLNHAEAVLARDPANVEALALSAGACEQVGQPDKAAGYRTLLKALGQNPEAAASLPPQPPEAERMAVSDGPTVSEAAIDAFLEEVLGNEPDIERPQITLADVGGLAEVKKRLNTSFLGPMRNPELRRMYGKSLRGGLLLYGPPGCGKTFLARAVAGELGARFFGVGLHDVLDMWLGKSEQNLHNVFETARRNTPCVLFLDEADALGMKRSNLSHSAGRNVVVQLLSELDSTRNDNDGLFILAATNQPWDLDSALRRPGRFDRMLLVLPPDGDARLSILRFHLKDRPVDPGIKFDRIANRTDGYSGADLRLLCEGAAEYALEDSLNTGKPRPINAKDFDRVMDEIKPSTRPWFEMAKNYAQFANDGGVYDDLLAYMRKQRLV